MILASNSPRRKELLQQLELSFTVHSAHIDESQFMIGDPRLAAQKLSYTKALDVFEQTKSNEVIVAADTIVHFKDKTFGKPHSFEEAYNMLTTLSGQVHQVTTGVTLLKKTRDEVLTDTFSETTFVEFYKLSKCEITSYLRTGEAFDKAGAYGIQGKGALFVRALEGDYYNVVGLPLASFIRHLCDFDDTYKLFN